MVLVKCIVVHCREETTSPDVLIDVQMCRTHRVELLGALHLHLKMLTTFASKKRWLATKPGNSWFADWVRMTEGVHRSRLELVGSKIEHSDLLSGGYGKVLALAKPHPSPKSQVFPFYKRKK